MTTTGTPRVWYPRVVPAAAKRLDEPPPNCKKPRASRVPASGSDGTRTRDLRRDRPPRHLGAPAKLGQMQAQRRGSRTATRRTRSLVFLPCSPPVGAVRGGDQGNSPTRPLVRRITRVIASYRCARNAKDPVDAGRSHRWARRVRTCDLSRVKQRGASALLAFVPGNQPNPESDATDNHRVVLNPVRYGRDWPHGATGELHAARGLLGECSRPGIGSLRMDLPACASGWSSRSTVKGSLPGRVERAPFLPESRQHGARNCAVLNVHRLVGRAAVYGTEGQRFESSRARSLSRQIVSICRTSFLACIA
jgi:hypothetical protein